MTKQREILVPQYMKTFSCIGPSCEDSCCIGWRVVIDEKTYKRYRKVKHPEITPLLDKQVTRIRSNPSQINYAKVKMEKGGRCPFLTEEMWCNIQLNLGEDHLSHTCATYPRTTNAINGVVETSCTVSCPEVARMALFNPEPMEFDQELGTIGTSQITREMDTKKPALANKLQRYIWELRIFTIQVLQDRQYQMWERLITLGMFYQKLQEYVEAERIQEVPQLIATYTNIVADGSLRLDLAAIPEQSTIQVKLLKELSDKRFFQGITSKRYLECFQEFLVGAGFEKDAKEEDIGERYHQAYVEYYQPYMAERQYILENYLVNYVFKNLFPLGAKGMTVFDEYVILVIHYSLIKMHLIGMAGKHQNLTDELVVKLIQSFAKTVEHNSTYLQQVRELLKENDITNMAFMAILIKN